MKIFFNHFFKSGYIFLLILIGCNKDEINDLNDRVNSLNEEIVTLKKVNNILELKSYILNTKQEDVLVKSIQSIKEQHQIKFENGDIIIVDSGIIKAFDVDSINWTTSLIFADSSKIETLFLGKPPVIRDSEVKLNPYNNTPLSALAEIKTPVNSKIEIRITGQDGSDSDITNTFEDYGKSHTFEIHGLYAGYSNTVEIMYLDKNDKYRCSSFIKITTKSLPSGFPEFEIIKGYETLEPNTVFLLDYRTSNIPFMVDRFGKIRWYSIGFSQVVKFGLQRFKNGNIGFGKAGLGQGSVFEYNMLGKLIREYSFYPNFESAHHDVYEMPNGNLLVPVNRNYTSTIEDYIIAIDRNSGEIFQTWDLNLILPKRYTFIHDEIDWLHINAVVYDEQDNSLIISGQRQGIFKVTWDNKLKWILAPKEGWNGYENYLLKNPNDAFEWVWGQHAPEITPNGNLLLFDNGFGRGYGSSPKFSRAVEFKITEEAIGGSIEKVWEYGATRGEEFSSPIISDVDFLKGGNRLITPGSLTFDVNYIDSDNMPSVWTTQSEKARIIEVNDTKVVFEMAIKGTQLQGSVYRSEKIKIYQ